MRKITGITLPARFKYFAVWLFNGEVFCVETDDPIDDETNGTDYKTKSSGIWNDSAHMKEKKYYNYLIGKDKSQVKHELGQEFNYFPSDVWTYHLKTNWLGKKTYLILYFKEEIIMMIKIISSYGKIWY